DRLRGEGSREAESCSERASCPLPPSPQSVQRSPLPRLLPRRVAAADTVVADTVVWLRMVAVWARTPWVAGSALADSAAADSPSAGAGGGGGVGSPAGPVLPGAFPPGVFAFSSFVGPPPPATAARRICA